MATLPDNNGVLSIDIPSFGNSYVPRNYLEREPVVAGSSLWWIRLWSCCEEEDVRLDQLVSHAGTIPPYIFLPGDAYTSP